LLSKVLKANDLEDERKTYLSLIDVRYFRRFDPIGRDVYTL
jgi:hypothetical protein